MGSNPTKVWETVIHPEALAETGEALRADLGRPTMEAFAADVGHSKMELRHLHGHVADWMKPKKVSLPLTTAPGKGWIQPEPLGVCLVIAPWNYPIQLLVEPLGAALAAGNCVVVKPSELAPHCSAFLAEALPKYVDPEAVVVVEGAVEETTALLDQRWDHIFFTGSTAVGRVVAAAAAKHLTPTVLELGGKSPTAADQIEKIAKVDPERVYITGISMGGMQTVATGCDNAKRWRGMAPVAMLSQTCAKLERPTPTISFHAMGDQLTSYDDDLMNMTAIAKFNNCKTGPTESLQYGGMMSSPDPVCITMPNGVGDADAPDRFTYPLMACDGLPVTKCRTWTECDDGVEVVFCTVDASTQPIGGHILYANDSQLAQSPTLQPCQR